jgi:hypothetical protein
LGLLFTAAHLGVGEEGSAAKDVLGGLHAYLCAPPQFTALTETLCDAAHAADARKKVAAGWTGGANVETAIASVVLPAMEAVAKLMSAWRSRTETGPASYAVAPAVTDYEVATAFLLRGLAYGGVAIVTYTPGARALVTTNVGMLDTAWGQAPPLADAVATTAVRDVVVRTYAKLEYPPGYCAPHVLFCPPPANPSKKEPAEARAKCWQCGRTVTQCATPHTCNSRAGLHVFPLGAASSYHAAYNATARAITVHASPPAGAKRGRDSPAAGAAAL